MKRLETLPGCGRAETGAVLVVVLLIAALLTAVITEFVFQVSLDISRVHNMEAAKVASLYARSGVVAAATMAAGRIRKYSYSYPGKISFPLPDPFSDGVGDIFFEIEDENGKIDLNTIVGNSPAAIRGRFMLRTLLENVGLDPDLSFSLTDYIDEDETSSGGPWNTESSAKNAPLWTVEELANVPGFTPEVFSTLRPYITVYNGLLPYENRINLNAAEKPVLGAIGRNAGLGSSDEDMEKAFDDTVVDEIIRKRQEEPLKEGDWQTRIGIQTAIVAINKEVSVRGRVFTMRSTGQVGGVQRIIEAVIDTGEGGGDLKVLAWREY